MQAGVITRSQHSRAQQEGCHEALLGGFSPPMRRRAASNEGDSQQQGSTLSDRVSKTAGMVSCRRCVCNPADICCILSCCLQNPVHDVAVSRLQTPSVQISLCPRRSILPIRWLAGRYKGLALCRRVTWTSAKIKRRQSGIATSSASY